MPFGFYIIMAAQFFSALADNALLIAAIAILREMHAPTEYEPLLKTLSMLGSAALGLGLVMVGAGLREEEALKPSPGMWTGTVLRLFVTPFVMGGFALFFGLSGMALTTVIICAAVPTAMNGYVFARQMGGDAPLYAATVTVQTALSFVTIPGFIWLAGQLT